MMSAIALAILMLLFGEVNGYQPHHHNKSAPTVEPD